MARSREHQALAVDHMKDDDDVSETKEPHVLDDVELGAEGGHDARSLERVLKYAT